MAKNIFLRGAPVLILALVMTVIGCKQDDGGDGGDPDPFLGATLNISGEQVYTEGYKDGLIYSKFENDLKIYSTDGGSGAGAIAKGKLTYTIGTPADTLKSMEYIFDDFYDDTKRWEDIKAEPSDVKGFRLYLTITGSDEYDSVARMNKVTSRNYTSEHVIYVYVNNDVTVTALERTVSGEYDGFKFEKKFESLNLSLKKGWNAVYFKEESLAGNTTESLSLRNPKNVRWVLEEW